MLYRNKGKLLLCSPCANVIRAENLWAKLGLERRKPINVGLMPRNSETFTLQFLYMLNAGKSVAEIAEAWGVTKVQLIGKVNRVRDLGYKIPHLHDPRGRKSLKERPDPTPAKPRRLGWRHNEHGGGMYGVTNCSEGADGGKCDPCKEVTSRTRKAERLRRKKREAFAKASAK